MVLSARQYSRHRIELHRYRKPHRDPILPIQYHTSGHSKQNRRSKTTYLGKGWVRMEAWNFTGVLRRIDETCHLDNPCRDWWCGYMGFGSRGKEDMVLPTTCYHPNGALAGSYWIAKSRGL